MWVPVHFVSLCWFLLRCWPVLILGHPYPSYPPSLPSLSAPAPAGSALSLCLIHMLVPLCRLLLETKAVSSTHGGAFLKWQVRLVSLELRLLCSVGHGVKWTRKLAGGSIWCALPPAVCSPEGPKPGETHQFLMLYQSDSSLRMAFLFLLSILWNSAFT